MVLVVVVPPVTEYEFEVPRADMTKAAFAAMVEGIGSSDAATAARMAEAVAGDGARTLALADVWQHMDAAWHRRPRGGSDGAPRQHKPDDIAWRRLRAGILCDRRARSPTEGRVRLAERAGASDPGEAAPSGGAAMHVALYTLRVTAPEARRMQQEAQRGWQWRAWSDLRQAMLLGQWTNGRHRRRVRAIAQTVSAIQHALGRRTDEDDDTLRHYTAPPRRTAPREGPTPRLRAATPRSGRMRLSSRGFGARSLSTDTAMRSVTMSGMLTVEELARLDGTCPVLAGFAHQRAHTQRRHLSAGRAAATHRLRLAGAEEWAAQHARGTDALWKLRFLREQPATRRPATVREITRHCLVLRGGPMLAAALRALQQKGESINAKDATGSTALLKVICDDPREIVDVTVLLDAGADPNEPNDAGLRPIHATVLQGSVAQTRALVTAGADLNMPCGRSPGLQDQRATETAWHLAFALRTREGRKRSPLAPTLRGRDVSGEDVLRTLVQARGWPDHLDHLAYKRQYARRRHDFGGMAGGREVDRYINDYAPAQPPDALALAPARTPGAAGNMQPDTRQTDGAEDPAADRLQRLIAALAAAPPPAGTLGRTLYNSAHAAMAELRMWDTPWRPPTRRSAAASPPPPRRPGATAPSAVGGTGTGARNAAAASRPQDMRRGPGRGRARRQSARQTPRPGGNQRAPPAALGARRTRTQRRVFTGKGARHAAIAHASLKHHAHVTAHNYARSRAVFYTTHPVFECLPLPRHFVNNDPGLPCAHMFEVLDREQAHRVYFDVDDGERAVPPEALLRQSAQGLVDWLNAEFGLQLTSGDLYVSSKCRPDKTSWWMVLHLRLRGMRARRRFKQLLQSARARDPRLAKVDPAPYQSTQLLAMIGCSKGTKPGYPRTPVTCIRGMRFAQGTTRHDHMIAVDVPGEPLLQCHMTPHAHGSATRDRRPAHGRRAAQAAAVYIFIDTYIHIYSYMSIYIAIYIYIYI